MGPQRSRRKFPRLVCFLVPDIQERQQGDICMHNADNRGIYVQVRYITERNMYTGDSMRYAG
jgi:hypothetical protein